MVAGSCYCWAKHLTIRRQAGEGPEKFRLNLAVGAKEKPSTTYVDGFCLERRARDSNSQPLTGHHISNVTANHSLTLQQIHREASHKGKPDGGSRFTVHLT